MYITGNQYRVIILTAGHGHLNHHLSILFTDYCFPIDSYLPITQIKYSSEDTFYLFNKDVIVITYCTVLLVLYMLRYYLRRYYNTSTVVYP